MIAQNEIKPITKTIIVLDDAAIGHQAFERRLQTLIDSRRFASMMGISQWYLLSLEKGRSKWNEQLIDRYNSVLRDINKGVNYGRV